MFPSLPAIGAASLLLLCAPAWAASSVQVLDAGATPRQTLRYRFSAGGSERAAMEMSMQMALSLGGQLIPMAAVPPIHMVMTMRATEVAADGSARLEFELVSAEAAGDGVEAAQVRQALSGAKGLAGWYTMDTQGHITAGGVRNPEGGADAASTSMLADLEQSLQQLAAPFPVDAVGAGARWQVVQQAETGGMKIAQTVEYTLRSRQGDRVELAVKMVDSKVDAGNALPPGAKLEGVTATGGGTTRIDLGKLVPTATIDADTTVSISAQAGGQSQKMDMNLKIRQSMGPEVSGP